MRMPDPSKECCQCFTAIEPIYEAPANRFVGGRWIPFCSSECAEKFDSIVRVMHLAIKDVTG